MWPGNWRLPQVLLMLGTGLTLWLLWLGTATPYFVFQALLWRAAYNAGLGAILYQQSQKEALTTWLGSFPAGGVSARVLQLLCPKEHDKRPLPFRAWMLFRCIVDVVLGMDVCSFLALCISCFQPVDGALDVLSILFGIVLTIIALAVKMDAHKVRAV
jgi:phosphatidylethanolamine N-methyltransferase